MSFKQITKYFLIASTVALPLIPSIQACESENNSSFTRLKSQDVPGEQGQTQPAASSTTAGSAASTSKSKSSK